MHFHARLQSLKRKEVYDFIITYGLNRLIHSLVAELNALSNYQQHPVSPQFFITEMKSNADLQLVVKAEDFDLALKELIPSISNSELLHYASIQKEWHN